jgi:hypothetical protein
METGQWVDGDLYNGRINSQHTFFKEPVFNYSGDFFYGTKSKFNQYGSNYEMAQEIILRAGIEMLVTLP